MFIRTGANWVQQAKLTTGDTAEVDQFGVSVSLSGDTAVIGAPVNDAGIVDSGAADVFVRSGSTWNQQAKLIASDPAVNDLFGWSVSVSVDTALVSAYLDDDTATDSGSVYVFLRTGASWAQQAKLPAGDAAANGFFGWPVSLSGETALIGAAFDDDAGIDSGAAYVFVRSGSTWSLQQKLPAGDAGANDFFGWSVSLSSETALMGAAFDDDAGIDSGAAYVFVRSGSTWSLQQKLTADAAAKSDLFGISVGVSGETALVGAYFDDTIASDAGSVYVSVFGTPTPTPTPSPATATPTPVPPTLAPGQIPPVTVVPPLGITPVPANGGVSQVVHPDIAAQVTLPDTGIRVEAPIFVYQSSLQFRVALVPIELAPAQLAPGEDDVRTFEVPAYDHTGQVLEDVTAWFPVKLVVQLSDEDLAQLGGIDDVLIAISEATSSSGAPTPPAPGRTCQRYSTSPSVSSPQASRSYRPSRWSDWSPL